jgi:hypothetical protein
MYKKTGRKWDKPILSRYKRPLTPYDENIYI